MICETPRSFAVATKNPIKLRALIITVKKFCNIRKTLMIKPPNNLNSQPVGTIEVLRGALHRALKAYQYADFGVGLEAGPIEFYSSTGFIEIQVALIIGPGERISIGLSPGFDLPASYIDGMLHGKELGDLVTNIRERELGKSIGLIGFLTRGYKTRQDLTVDSIMTALLPWINNYYQQLPTVNEFLDKIGL